MSKKKKILALLLAVFIIAVNFIVIVVPSKKESETVTAEITLKSEEQNEFQVFYLTPDQKMSKDFNEGQSQKVWYDKSGEKETFTFSIPRNIAYFRLDFGNITADTEVESVVFRYGLKKIKMSGQELLNTMEEHSVKLKAAGQNGILVEAGKKDPYIAWDVRELGIETCAQKADNIQFYGFKVMLLLVIDLGYLLVMTHFERMVSLPKELIQNRKLIANLAKNDFKTKFAGSFFGTFWAFVQPIITVLVYWFVFEKGLKAGGQLTAAGIQVPFVLWLIAGMVPWFFFSDALGSGTNAMMEYSYLVKKVVFKISILPIVKVISALFVHLFFIAFTILLYAAYSYYPDLYTLQIVYYSFALLIFTLALVYGTCAIVIFFKDLTQIINIILQVGVWITPIMWNIDTMNLSPILIAIFKLNPLYYIVAGYRDALINKVWFFEHPGLTLYFWIVTLLLLTLGTSIFKRLRVHFADVL